MKSPTFSVFALAYFVFNAPSAIADAHDDHGKPDGWTTSFVFGIASTPSYLGDDDSQLTAFPDLRLEYGDRFFASLLTGIGYNVVRTEHWRAGPVVRYVFGRDEQDGNPLRIAGDEPTDLLGLGDINGSIEAGGFVAYESGPWKTKFELRQDIGEGHEGLVAQFETKLTGQVSVFGKPSYYSVGPEVLYGDASYNQAYFGITSQQSLTSGLSPFVADSGLVSYGLHGNIVRPLNDKWSLGAFGGYDKLANDVRFSPLIIERGDENQFIGGVFINYRY